MESSDYPFDGAAARMLAAGLERTTARTGQSVRQLAPSLGYRTSVVLSHMASGRVPIPVDRVIDLADGLEIDRKGFLAAVLRQRHPDIDFSILATTATEGAARSQIDDLTGGRSIDELSAGQRRVVREAIADQQAQRRWLTPHEVLAVELLRSLRPAMASDGLGRSDVEAIRAALAGARPKSA